MNMKPIASVLLLIGLAGCDFTAPLSTSPQAPLAAGLTGLWERTDDESKSERLMLLPLAADQVLVSYPHGDAANSLFGSAFAVEIQGLELMQIRWLGNGKGEEPDDGKVYQFARVDLADEQLSVRLVRPNALPSGLATTEALKAAMAEHASDPDLYGEAMVFKRVQP